MSINVTEVMRRARDLEDRRRAEDRERSRRANAERDELRQLRRHALATAPREASILIPDGYRISDQWTELR